MISSERAKSVFDIKGIKNDTNNLTDYYLEIYSNDEIYVGSEINLKWRPFPNTEFFIHYDQIEEGNPFNSKLYIDIINRKLKEELGFEKDYQFENLNRVIYEINTEFYDPSVINAYRNLSLKIDKYKNKEEGAYELMRDNLKSYLDLYENPLSDGNINIYINGEAKKKFIKLIIRQEKKLIKNKIEHLNKVIKGIQNRNIDVSEGIHNNNDISDNNNEEENKDNNDNNSKDNNDNKNIDKEEL